MAKGAAMTFVETARAIDRLGDAVDKMRDELWSLGSAEETLARAEAAIPVVKANVVVLEKAIKVGVSN